MDDTDTNSQNLFISEQHPVSRRWAIVEDDGRVAWLYLTMVDSQELAADCWLYNRVATPAVCDGIRDEPPVVPQTHADDGATLPQPKEASVRLCWSPDGESVAVFIDSELIGFIAAGHDRGYSRHIRVSGMFGNVLDLDLFQRVFGTTIDAVWNEN